MVDIIIATKIVNVDKNLEEDEIVIPVPRILLERCKRTERKEREEGLQKIDFANKPHLGFRISNETRVKKTGLHRRITHDIMQSLQR